MSAPSSQELALTYLGLTRVLRDRAFLDLWFRGFRRRYPHLKERRRIERRIKGVLEHWLPLSRYLRGFLRRDPQELEPSLELVVLVGAYRLLFEAIPPYAVVDQAVDSLPERERRARGFVNAVLRRLAEAGKEGWERFLPTLPLPERWGFPEFWEKHLKEVVPEEELPRLFQGLREPLPLYLAPPSPVPEEAFLELCYAEGLHPQRTGVPLVFALTGEEKQQYFRSSLYQGGKAILHDLSIFACLELILPRLETPLWDPFAAPGGKILYLTARGKGQFFASDQKVTRLKLIVKEGRRTGVVLPHLFAARIEEPPLRPGTLFATILCDLPCTASGTVPLHPEIALRLKEEDLARFSELQLQWLRRASVFLKPGGILWFSTCSLFPEENEEVARRFLQEEQGFEPLVLRHPFEGKEQSLLRFYPHRHKTIGFGFQGFLKRKESL